jgi:hypothetical protein
MFMTSPLGESRLAPVLPGSYVRGTRRNAAGGAESGTERR